MPIIIIVAIFATGACALFSSAWIIERFTNTPPELFPIHVTNRTMLILFVSSAIGIMLSLFEYQGNKKEGPENEEFDTVERPDKTYTDDQLLDVRTKVIDREKMAEENRAQRTIRKAERIVRKVKK